MDIFSIFNILFAQTRGWVHFFVWQKLAVTKSASQLSGQNIDPIYPDFILFTLIFILIYFSTENASLSVLPTFYFSTCNFSDINSELTTTFIPF